MVTNGAPKLNFVLSKFHGQIFNHYDGKVKNSQCSPEMALTSVKTFRDLGTHVTKLNDEFPFDGKIRFFLRSVRGLDDLYKLKI